MIAKREIVYKSFGRCLEIYNGSVRLVVTLDFGPRIICYSRIGGENIFFEDEKRVFSQPNEHLNDVLTHDTSWYIYGGHRLWTAPESFETTYYPDNTPVAYELTECGARFIPPVQKSTKYAIELLVELSECGSDVMVEHRLTNCSDKDISLSLWPITVLSPGGQEIVPLPDGETGCAPRTKMTFWDYVKMTDSRLTWLDRYILLRQDAECDSRIKFGINNQHGYAIYLNHGDAFIKRFPVKYDGNYPDGGMTFETFTNPLFLEMESLSELTMLKTGEAVYHTEQWSLYRAEMPMMNDIVIDEFVKEYIIQ